MRKFTTEAEAFEFLGLDFNKLPDVSTFPEDDREHTLDDYILKTVIKAHIKANDPEWKANFTGIQENWYNWFWVKDDPSNKSGFGFSHSRTFCVDSITSVGARFCMPSQEMAKWVRDQFTQLYLNVQVKV